MEVWTPQQEQLIADIMVSETQHDTDCRGCESCDDSDRPSCHTLCGRPEAIRRMQRRSPNGVYTVREPDAKIYARQIKRWSKTFLADRKVSLSASATL